MHSTIGTRMDPDDFTALKAAAKTKSISSIVSEKIKQFIEAGAVQSKQKRKSVNTSICLDIDTAVKLKALAETIHIPVSQILDAAVQEIIHADDECPCNLHRHH